MHQTLILLPTQKDTLFLVIFVDMYSRKVTGCSMSTRMKDSLVIDAFLQGYGRENPEQGLLVHTDQGTQYTSSNFQPILKKVWHCFKCTQGRKPLR